MTIYQTQLGPIATNCYIVADEEKNAAVVDPGAEAARVKKILDDHQLRLRAVLLTHGHFDHIGGIKGLIEAFPDAEVVIGEKDAPMLAKKPGAMWTPYIDEDDYTGLSATRLVKEGDAVQVGALEFSVLDTPGHTRGGVAISAGTACFPATRFSASSAGAPISTAGIIPPSCGRSKSCTICPEITGCCRTTMRFSTLEEERRGNPYMKEAVR